MRTMHVDMRELTEHLLVVLRHSNDATTNIDLKTVFFWFGQHTIVRLEDEGTGHILQLFSFGGASLNIRTAKLLPAGSHDSRNTA